MLQIDFEMKRQLRALSVLCCVLLYSTAAAGEGGCEGAVPLTLPGLWRGFGGTGSEVLWLRLDVRSAGVVTLDATVPLTAPTEPVLTVLGPECKAPREDENSFVYLQRGATHQVFLVRTPGEYFVRILPQDPLAALASYRVTAELDEEARRLTKDTEEPEIDPDDSSGGGCENGPIAGKDTEEPEIDPDDSSVPGVGDGDDHADTLTSATPLAFCHEVAGEIGNGWGDDSDVFRFTLAEPRIVSIETHGEVDTVGALLDDVGSRLHFDDDGGSGKNARLVKALVPGRYFVRVEGRGAAEGSYSLTLETWGWGGAAGI